MTSRLCAMTIAWRYDPWSINSRKVDRRKVVTKSTTNIGRNASNIASCNYCIRSIAGM